MKKTPVVIASVLIVLLAVLLIRPFRTAGTPVPDLPPGGVEYYTCPMHPSVIAYKPGHCPVCGMTLVKKIRGEEPGAGDAHGGSDVVVTGEQRAQADITTVPVRRTALSTSVSASGVIAFAEPGRSIVAARSRGRIERLFVSRTGAIVRKGEPLLTLYSPDLISAGEEYIVALNGDTAASRGEILEASRKRLLERYGLTESQVSALGRDRDVPGAATYRSPIAGTVIRKPVVEGEYVDEGTTLFELADLSRVWVIASVPEQDIASVRAGEPAEVTLDAYPGTLFRGRVGLVEPVLDAESRTVRVRIELGNAGGNLKPNMFARVTLKGATREVLAVPASAVLFTGRMPVVWVESAPGRFVRRMVGVGLTSGGMTELLSGVNEGEMVASTGGFLIDSESQLESPAGGEHEGHHM